MSGMDMYTGRWIDGVAHLSQSIAVILTTPLASRIKRRTFGSDVPNLIDAASNQVTLVQVYAAIATALARWEPRLTLTRVAFDTEAMTSGAFFRGQVPLRIEGFTQGMGGSVPVTLTVPLSVGSGS
ncbi:GPW/gp25 family protein [Burkholderia gladioli]|uniref:GPW/gp25 family protein n=1 Tax=Burkholderia gladioli TaxID=28095 RepID=UPI001641B3AE|nr:GPW/gp25 family protein [Burkholderia gladioli]